MKPVEKMTYQELVEAQQRHRKILSNKYAHIYIDKALETTSALYFIIFWSFLLELF